MDPSLPPGPHRPPPWLLPLATVLAALAFAAAVATLGGIAWGLGRMAIFTSQSSARPALLAAACLGALALLWRRHPAPLAGWFRSETLWRRLLAILLIIVAGNALGGPQVILGDSIEYIVQTQSLALDGRISPDTAARAAYWNMRRPGGIALRATRPPTRVLDEKYQSGGNFGGLYADRAGTYRYYHFWGYPAFVAPVYLLAHAADPSGRLEYHSFRLVNAALLCLMFAMAYALWPGWPTILVLTLSLLSPILAYCDWQHPEIYCLFFTFAAFWATEWGGRARHAGPALLGLAASQNPPLLLFFPLHLLHVLKTERPLAPRALPRLALRYLPGCVLGLAPMVYFKWHFGVWSVIGAVGLASTGYASAGRVADMVFSPLIGALWLMPAFFLLPLAAATRRHAWFVACAFASVFAAGWLATSTRNFNAGQVGTVRYMVWLSAPLLFAALRGAPHSSTRPGRGHLAALGAAAVLAVLVSSYFHVGEMMAKDTRRFREAARARPEVAAIYRICRYRDDVELLSENILGHELHRATDFKGVYVWNLGHGRSVWVVSRAARERLRRFAWRADALPSRRVEPPGSVRFEHRDGVATMAAGSAPLAVHPVLGPYTRVWMDAEIDGVETNVPLIIR